MRRFYLFSVFWSQASIILRKVRPKSRGKRSLLFFLFDLDQLRECFRTTRQQEVGKS